MRIKGSAVSFLLLFPFVAQAGFVSTDWKTQGDGKVLLDQSTGLEWLKLSETHNQSYDAVVSQLSTTYSGWRLPTGAEVLALYRSILSPVQVSTSNVFSRAGAGSQQGLAVFRFKTLLGQTVNNANVSYFLGAFVDEAGVYRQWGTYSNENGAYNGYLGTSFTFQFNRHLSFSQTGSFASTYSNTMAGVFLVSDGGVTLSSLQDPTLNINNPNAPVNTTLPSVDVPVSFGISGALLLALAGLRRKQ